MGPNERNIPEQSAKGKLPAAETGNASNPSPHSMPQQKGGQLLDNKAEKYLREVANIEDLPDAQDQQDMDETLSQENKK
jgi:hypothetical protein